MTRSKRLAVTLALAGVAAWATAAPAAAQSAGPAAAPGAEQLVGSWEGPYATDGPSGTMSLGITRAGTVWKLEVSMGAEAPPPGAPTDVAAVGNVLTWKQVFGEYDVSFKATLSEDGGQLAGTLEATQGGAYAGGGSFTLKRKM